MIAFALKQSSQAHNFNQSLSCWYTFVYYICYSTALISGMEVKGEAISAVWLVGISTTSLAEGCRRAVNNVANLAETTQHFVEDNRYPVQDAIENLNRYVQIIGIGDSSVRINFYIDSTGIRTAPSFWWLICALFNWCHFLPGMSCYIISSFPSKNKDPITPTPTAWWWKERTTTTPTAWWWCYRWWWWWGQWRW